MYIFDNDKIRGRDLKKVLEKIANSMGLSYDSSVHWFETVDEPRNYTLAGHLVRTQEEVQTLRKELRTANEEFSMLLNHLGLTIVTQGSKTIQKKYKAKGKKKNV